MSRVSDIAIIASNMHVQLMHTLMFGLKPLNLARAMDMCRMHDEKKTFRLYILLFHLLQDEGILNKHYSLIKRYLCPPRKQKKRKLSEEDEKENIPPKN